MEIVELDNCKRRARFLIGAVNKGILGCSVDVTLVEEININGAWVAVMKKEFLNMAPSSTVMYDHNARVTLNIQAMKSGE